MATLHIKPLDGADGYLRWKESVPLRLHTLGVAHVLSDDPPAGGPEEAKKWARDDALCRGHILAALSDHLLPVYVRHGTGRALWRAVARTYEPDSLSWELKFEELEFRDDETLLERVARAEALAFAASRSPMVSDELVAYKVCTKLPEVAEDAIIHGDETTMDGVWRSAQGMERVRNGMLARVIRLEREDMMP
ncbi:uncharacterized protein C2845_PM13G12660 [Panicum miliaceum]|uniref:Uncharacterized protein n=1 Tax=Panicum miliaceum TaxID=4540 RepID=A0A3L6RHI5_PANMI|nr:uncharacterized protein C2845_PM13G12660 [Panicum miliaceum]